MCVLILYMHNISYNITHHHTISYNKYQSLGLVPTCSNSLIHISAQCCPGAGFDASCWACASRFLGAVSCHGCASVDLRRRQGTHSEILLWILAQKA